jgi:glycosyltransferase involved in cell wall biosynthesis
MRVAHVIAAMDYGGAERVLVDLALRGVEAGLEVAIVAPSGLLDRDWSALGIERFVTPGADRNPLEVGHAAYSVRSALQAWKPDVVHSHNVKATALALFGSRAVRRRLPVLSTLHGVGPDQMRIAAQILRYADTVVAVSDDVRRAVIRGGLPDRCLHVVHNGVDPLPALPLARRLEYDRELGLEGDVVAAVGRLVPVKAHGRFLEAAAAVLRERPHTTFLLIGDGPERPALERLAGELGIESSLRFTGARTDARALIERADLLVFSSLHEGHSIAALEGLAAGTPVVSTDVGGMRHLLGAGAGRIVGQANGALAEAIVALLDDPELREEMGAAGRLVAAELSTRAMLSRYAELYAETIR